MITSDRYENLEYEKLMMHQKRIDSDTCNFTIAGKPCLTRALLGSLEMWKRLLWQKVDKLSCEIIRF